MNALEAARTVYETAVSAHAAAEATLRAAIETHAAAKATGDLDAIEDASLAQAAAYRARLAADEDLAFAREALRLVEKAAAEDDRSAPRRAYDVAEEVCECAYQWLRLAQARLGEIEDDPGARERAERQLEAAQAAYQAAKATEEAAWAALSPAEGRAVDAEMSE